MSTEPLLVSGRTAKSLWQRYEIHSNRLELRTLLRNIVIPFERIKNVEVVPPFFKAFAVNLRPGMKLDMADLYEHVVVEKAAGFVRRIAFTPEDPKEFARQLENAWHAAGGRKPTLVPLRQAP